MKSRRGFTLIEMLVVLGIISILSGILFSVYAQAREKGRQITCVSNIRQLGLAFTEYADDNDETLPLSGHSGTTPACAGIPDGSWVLPEFIDTSVASGCTAAQLPVPNGALFSYVRNTKVYQCPSDRFADGDTLSYSMNSNLSAVRIAAIRDPVGCVLILDEGDTLDNGNFLAPTGDTARGAPIYTDTPATRHSGGAEFVFSDGHVKWRRGETVKTASYDPATVAH